MNINEVKVIAFHFGQNAHLSRAKWALTVVVQDIFIVFHGPNYVASEISDQPFCYLSGLLLCLLSFESSMRVAAA